MNERERKRRSTTLGIRVDKGRIESVRQSDETLHGVYWFDLSTRQPVGAAAKRAIDVVVASLLVVALSPLLLVIVLSIRLGSPGPAIYRQRRIGFRCSEFDMYKFRTMVIDAERRQAELAAEHGGSFFKLRDDPRVTPVGRWLRRTSLDELPQLFNVLNGTMSLVGPRPLLVSDLERFPLRGQMRRFSVRPGMTGLWQVSGRSETTEEERMRLDREYVNRWSLWLDLKIMVQTIGVVVSGRGAT